MTKPVATPKQLSREAGALYQSCINEYNITDAVGRKHVELGCEALDRLREAQADLKRQGLTCRDRHGVLKANPTIATERAARAAYVAAFKLLKLEPPEVK